jgi:riboflavin synthase
MFTGIIQKTTKVSAAHKRGSVYAVRFEKPAGWKLALGQSISVDGICSTVTACGATFFEVDYMQETLKKTTAGSFKKGVVVNLERSMTPKSFIDGHLVQGHVDARATVSKIEAVRDSARITVTVPLALMSYIAPQGSVSINGVSLTVASVRGRAVTVALIPYTLTHTNLGTLRNGDVVNIEADVVARYLHRMLRARMPK